MKILSVLRLGLFSIIDLLSEFKEGMHTWFGDNRIPLKKKKILIIDLKVKRFTRGIRINHKSKKCI